MDSRLHKMAITWYMKTDNMNEIAKCIVIWLCKDHITSTQNMSLAMELQKFAPETQSKP